MGKPKRNSNNTIKKFKDGDTSDEEYIDTVDPSASEFVYDAVDEYYENEEREGAENLAKLMKRKKKPLQVMKTVLVTCSISFNFSDFIA